MAVGTEFANIEGRYLETRGITVTRGTMQYRTPVKIALMVVATVVAAACSGGMQSPVSPSAAVRDANSALNADGSNLKASAPAAVSPLFEITNVSLTPTLAAVGSRGVNASGVAFSYRFQ